MLRYVVMGVVLSMTLAGCANKPSKEAPIETRAALEAVNKTVVPSKAVEATNKTVVPSKTVLAPPVQPTKTLSEAGQTRPLRSDEMQSKPLDPQAAPESAKIEPVKSVVVAPPVRPKARTFQFDYDSAALAAADHASLEAHGAFLKAQPSLELMVQGHADERGSREYNLALGQRRAESVKQALGLLGVPDARIEAVSLGSEKPVTEGRDEAAWKQNRRAVLIYKDER